MCADLAEASLEAPISCPVGAEVFVPPGHPFEQRTWGRRPDGKILTTVPSPPPLSECPGNRLIIFREFSDTDLPTLSAAIGEPAYAALIDTETQYYRAAWLARRLNPTSIEAAELMMKATWETAEESSRRSRYLSEFARYVSELPSNTEDLAWIELSLRAANAMRELHDYDRALQFLANVPRGLLDVVVPEEIHIDVTERGYGIANSDAIQEAERRRDLLRLLDNLSAAVQRRDSSIELLELLFPSATAWRCMEFSASELSTSPAREACSSAEVQRWIEVYNSNGTGPRRGARNNTSRH
jgi:hypothetical protein